MEKDSRSQLNSVYRPQADLMYIACKTVLSIKSQPLCNIRRVHNKLKNLRNVEQALECWLAVIFCCEAKLEP